LHGSESAEVNRGFSNPADPWRMCLGERPCCAEVTVGDNKRFISVMYSLTESRRPATARVVCLPSPRTGEDEPLEGSPSYARREQRRSLTRAHCPESGGQPAPVPRASWGPRQRFVLPRSR